MSYTFETRTGFGITFAWDVLGGTTWATLGTVIDGDKVEAKADTVKTTLLSQIDHTYMKTGVEPGTMKFSLIYDPLSSEYAALAAQLRVLNAAAPNWQVNFLDAGTGNGSGACTETFRGHVVGLSREFQRGKFLSCDVTIQLTGNPGFHA